jgi:hypothetical protein
LSQAQLCAAHDNGGPRAGGHQRGQRAAGTSIEDIANLRVGLLGIGGRVGGSLAPLHVRTCGCTYAFIDAVTAIKVGYAFKNHMHIVAADEDDIIPQQASKWDHLIRLIRMYVRTWAE